MQTIWATIIKSIWIRITTLLLKKSRYVTVRHIWVYDINREHQKIAIFLKIGDRIYKVNKEQVFTTIK